MSKSKSKSKRPSQRVGVSGQHPPFPRRAGLWIALGLTALAPGAALAAFPANLELSVLDGSNGFRLSGAAALDRSGFSVSKAGDINGDGVDDLLIGASRADPNSYSSGAVLETTLIKYVATIPPRCRPDRGATMPSCHT